MHTIARNQLRLIPYLLIGILLFTGCGSSSGGGTDQGDTTAPNEVLNFTALPGDGSVTLGWILPQVSDLGGLMLRRSTTASPTISSGEEIFSGLAGIYVDQDVTNGTTYYYSAFTYDNSDNYSDGVSLPCTPRVAVGIAFTDANFEQCLRNELGIPTGSITDLDLLTLFSLDARHQSIADLQGLQYCLNLRNLDLRNNLLTDAGNTQLLAELPLLEELDLSTNDISIIPNLAGLANLEEFYISSNPIGSLSPLSGVTSLKRLQFGSCTVSDLTPLASLINLERLSFQDTPNITSLTGVGSLTNLQILTAQGGTISSLSPLSGLTNITSISVSNGTISDLTPIAGLSRLMALELLNHEISNLDPITAMTQLEVLSLANNEIVDLTPLTGMVNLTLLDISWNDVRDIGMVSGMSGLQYLSAHQNYISDISPLLGLSALVNVSLGWNPLTSEGVLTHIPPLEIGGATVVFDFDMNLIDLMGPWVIESVTIDSAPTDPGEFFGWDPAAVSNRLLVFPLGHFETHDLAANDDVLYNETGTITVAGTSITVTTYTEDGVDVPPYEAFAGSWAIVGGDLVMTMTDTEVVELTWSRLVVSP
ncbi:MAG: hypothetical protein GY835_25370 [bacterium]|nr:hypothetical protein [bacterium]